MKFRLLAVLLVLLAQGCFDYEEEIVVHPNGRVDIAMTSSIVETSMPYFKQRPEYQIFLAAAAGKDNLDKLLPEELKIDHAKAVNEDGWVHADLRLHVDDIQDLQSALQGFSGGQSFKYFEDDDGSIVFERILYKPEIDSRMPPDLFESLVTKHWKNSQLRFSLSTPLEILETNGMRLTDNTVRWQTNLATAQRLGIRLFARFKAPPKPLYAYNTFWVVVGGALLVVLGASIFVFWSRRTTRNREAA